MPKGRYFLAVDEDGVIRRRTYIKGAGVVPRGAWADKLVEYPPEEYPDIAKVSQAFDMYFMKGKEFQRRADVRVTNSAGPRMIEVGETAVITFEGVPDEVTEFKVKVGDQDVVVTNGDTIELTSSVPTRIAVKITDHRLYHYSPYDVLFLPPRPDLPDTPGGQP